MKITVLIEDQKPSRNDLKYEHGVSLYCESNGSAFLFDLGATDAFLENARTLKADVSKADFAVISHAHYDHGGGLAAFFAANPSAKVYISAYAGGEYYVKQLKTHEYAGLDRVLLSLNEDRLCTIREDTEIAPGIHIVSHLSTPHPLPAFCRLMEEKQDGNYLPDPLLHEIFLCAVEEDGVKVLTGCSHHGILNILENAQDRFGPLSALVGGFHLYGTRIFGLRLYGESAKSVQNIASKLCGIKKIHTGHCTGMKAFKTLRDIAGAVYLKTGDVLEI